MFNVAVHKITKHYSSTWKKDGYKKMAEMVCPLMCQLLYTTIIQTSK